jgi:hypothetical protein
MRILIYLIFLLLLALLLAAWIAVGAFTGDIAAKKGYSRPAFFALGLATGLLGLIIAVLLSDRRAGISAGSLVRFTKALAVGSGATFIKGFATTVHQLDVIEGTPSALIDGPDGARYWVPKSALIGV